MPRRLKNGSHGHSRKYKVTYASIDTNQGGKFIFNDDARRDAGIVFLTDINA